ncbi:hypothetical protein C8R44DRAFT_796408 [Mycena epipterygia]|nr:hypothetical protein C8R44DRAFT_796408 [Mycena epipterygia]
MRTQMRCCCCCVSRWKDGEACRKVSAGDARRAWGVGGWGTPGVCAAGKEKKISHAPAKGLSAPAAVRICDVCGERRLGVVPVLLRVVPVLLLVVVLLPVPSCAYSAQCSSFCCFRCSHCRHSVHPADGLVLLVSSVDLVLLLACGVDLVVGRTARGPPKGASGREGGGCCCCGRKRHPPEALGRGHTSRIASAGAPTGSRPSRWG